LLLATPLAQHAPYVISASGDRDFTAFRARFRCRHFRDRHPDRGGAASGSGSVTPGGGSATIARR
jgi:hypothetical protein